MRKKAVGGALHAFVQEQHSSAGAIVPFVRFNLFKRVIAREEKGVSEYRTRRILAVASGGGHWEQLLILQPAFSGCDVHYATTLEGLADHSRLANAHLIPDCNRDEKLRILYSAFSLFRLLMRIRPDVVVTTGALPGLLALMIARRFGIRTVWIDSIANAEEMSLAGQTAGRHSDLWLSQWPDVARAAGADYSGAVL